MADVSLADRVQARADDRISENRCTLFGIMLQCQGEAP